MKKLALLVLVCTLLGGCQDRREADALTIVAGVAIDTSVHGYMLHTELVKLSSGSSDMESVCIKSAGETMTEAIAHAEQQTGHAVQLTHAQTLILGKEIAEQGIQALVDTLSGQSDYRLSVRLLVAQEEAAAVLQVPHPIEPIHSFALREMLSVAHDTAYTPDIPFYQFASEWAQAGIDPILPYVSVLKTQETEILSMGGSALFSEQGMVGTLDTRMTQLLLWLRGDTDTGVLSRDDVALQVLKSQSEITATAQGATISLHLEVQQTEGSLSQEMVAANMGAELSVEIEGLLAQLQAQGCDSLGIGETIARTDVQAWQTLAQDWYTIHYPSYPVAVQVDVDFVAAQRTVEE